MILFSYRFKAYRYFFLCSVFWVSPDSFAAASAEENDVFSSSPSPAHSRLPSRQTPASEADHLINQWKEKTLSRRRGKDFSSSHIPVTEDLGTLLSTIHHLESGDACLDNYLSLAQKQAEDLYNQAMEQKTFEEGMEALKPPLIQLLSKRNSLQRKRRGATSQFSPYNIGISYQF
jgi:hypothetical protein